MNEYSQQIRKELDSFQSSIQKLSLGIKTASSLWKDPKYTELSSEMVQVANLSKTVLVAGDKGCEVVDKFFKVASEEY